MTVSTPVGADALLIQGLEGHEGISTLYRYYLDTIAENTTAVPFDKLLGQKILVSLELPGGKDFRFFHGICSRVARGNRSEVFTQYQLEIVPEFWLLTKKSQSRIFQKRTVPDILKKVLEGLNVTFQITGSYQPRVYCVQYQETDYNFACRLMEEEGILYFFTHSADGHKMVVSDQLSSHSSPEVWNGSQIIYGSTEGQHRDKDRILSFSKAQEIRSGKITFFDHSFELPHKHLDVQQVILGETSVGEVTHKLKVGPTEQLEIYEHPGGYAKRFDEKPDSIRPDGERLAKLRMQLEECNALVIEGEGVCRQFTSGHTFGLVHHWTDNGKYLLVSVSHSCRQHLVYRSSDEYGEGLEYSNRFTCIPAAIPFRPPRTAIKPVIHGSQTAVVVGPPGEEIHTDKYGRIKVQFHWDRDGRGDAESSAWVRMATGWAGKRWGMLTIPRIGHEVVVDFMEGDPDRPIVVGSVYNADHTQAYPLPGEKTKSYVKSFSSLGGGGFNELRFEDKKGKEQIFIHAERNEDVRIKNDRYETIGANQHLIAGGNQMEMVKGDKHLTVKGDQNERIDGTLSQKMGMDHQEKVGMNYALDAGMAVHLKAGMTVVVEAGVQLSLKVGGNFIDINPAGVFIQGTIVMINSGGAAGSGAGCSPDPPKEPMEADKAEPGQVSQARPDPPKPAKPLNLQYGSLAKVFRSAADNGTPLCDI
jgi:type VI secretion system secreted protein VgrG